MGLGAWLKIVAYVVGVVALAAIVWFAGPLLSINGVNPFDSPFVRAGLIALAATLAVTAIGFEAYRRKKAQAAIAENLTQAAPEESDAQVLSDKMKDAISTLKKAAGAQGDVLYDLPWYLMIGPPGSGKTTALINSGLRFPLSRGGTPEAVAGIGGTRYCDWWFTEDAVLIDTAGRYTTQDSDPKGDHKSWLAFLDLLKRNRPRQPINGVMVAISLEDIATLDQTEIAAHADAIRKRLMELNEQLKVEFPVYAMFTKADLVAGFMEFFAHLNEKGRAAVWGHTFQTDDKTRNMIGEVPAEYDLVVERMNKELVDRLQEEPTPTARVQLYGFPSHMAALKKPVFEFLNRIFEPTRYHSNATLRGFYFTSGTQHGTPFDQLLGALSRSFGAEAAHAPQLSGLGKSYFITDLLHKVIFGEAGWVSINRRAVRRNFLIKSVAYTALFGAVAAAVSGWWVSYGHNSDLIGRGYTAVTQFRAKAAPLREEVLVADRDFGKVLEALQLLRSMPAGYAARNEATPIQARLGLNQKPRLNSAAESSYQNGLERMLRPRLLFRLEELIRTNIADAGFVYEALSIYLMIGGRERMDTEQVLGFMRRDWSERLFRGADNAAGRAALEQHMSAMLSFEAPDDSRALPLDEALIQEAQRTLGRMGIAERAFELLRAQARVHTARDWVVRKEGGQDAALVFETIAGGDLDTVRVPFFFTYAGFHEAFLGRMEEVIAQVQRERRLLGEVGAQQAVSAQYESLVQELLERYRKDFTAAWQTNLARLRIKLLTADRPRYVALQAAAAATSPIAQLIESIKRETSLTREQTAAEKAATPPAGQAPARANLGRPGGDSAGAPIEREFRTFHALVEGERGRRPVDELIKSLTDVHQALIKINDPQTAAEGNALFRTHLQSLRAAGTRFPAPFANMLQTAANAFDGDATGTTVARLARNLGDQVTRSCQEATANKYPFSRGSSNDMSVEEFQKMFGPQGVIDRFFQVNLAAMADTSKAVWTWNPTNPVAKQLSNQMLGAFQRAATIREAFFPAGAPGFAFAMKNLSLADPAESARLEINGGVLVTEKPKPPAAPGGFSIFGSPPPPPPPTPVQPPPIGNFQWPGPIGLRAATITVNAATTGGAASTKLNKTGDWSFFRLLDGANVSRSGPALVARFNVGGREVSYQINVNSSPNPFTLPALREFRCPTFQ